MSKIPNIEVGDLLINRKTKTPWIVLESKPYNRKAYGALVPAPRRKKFLVVNHAGHKEWVIDTALKVSFYLPCDPWFKDIR